ncbi:MAG: nicotinamide riboside transporter PnuC [Bacteroidota bacterium]
MSPIFEFFFGQYSGYATIDIALEITAVVFGFVQVWLSKQNKVWTFPAGMVSTAIFVYLLLKWELLGDMLINGYYFIMSIYGWYVWTRKVDVANVTPISETTKNEWNQAFVIFIATLIFVYLVYTVFDKWNSWTAYVDTFTTGLFFVGMWLMAKRKIENWLVLIAGDIISIPLYFYKGLTFTSLQYALITVIAIFGYLSWKQHLNKPQTLQKTL